MSKPSTARRDSCIASCSLAPLTISVLLLSPAAVLAQQAPQGAPGVQAEAALRAGNFEQAAALLQQRAQAGDAEAQYHLASLYRTGRGVPHDDVMAFRWMKAAAEKGHAKAQFNLARMYLAGRGVAADAGAAQNWLAKSAARGLAEASALLSELDAAPRPARQVASTGGWSATVAVEGPQASAAPAPRLPPGYGEAAILEAAWRGQAQVVARLIASGASAQVRNADGNTPLALAAAGGHRDTVGVLLQAGADANAANHAGDTPLLLAAAKGHAEVVAALLDKGADPSGRNAAGDTALTNAVRSCSVAAVRALIRRGAGTGARAAGGMTALMLASSLCGDAVTVLTSTGSVPLNAEDDQGCTALWHAADRGNAVAIAALLARGADPRVADKAGRTPLLRAVENGEKK